MDCQHGALIALQKKGGPDISIWKLRHLNAYGETTGDSPGAAQAAFGKGLIPVDGLYTVNTMDKEITEVGLGVAPDGFRCTTFRDSDLKKFLWIKVYMPPLPDGCEWKKGFENMLFDTIEVEVGAQVMTEISLSRLVAIAKARNMWPRFHNNPRNHRKDQEWTLAIPIMDSIDIVPIIALAWHEHRVIISKVRDLSELVSGASVPSPMGKPQIQLTTEQIYLDNASRKGVAADTRPNTDKDDSAKDETTSRLDVVFKQQSVYKEDIGTQQCKSRARLRFGTFITHIVCTYKLDKPVSVMDGPVASIEVFIDGIRFQKFDRIEVEELNWLRCGVLSPMKYRSGAETTDTFHYLIPFGSDCLIPGKVATTWLSAYRFESVEIRISPAGPEHYLPCGTITFAEESLNIKRYRSNMCGLGFL